MINFSSGNSSDFEGFFCFCFCFFSVEEINKEVKKAPTIPGVVDMAGGVMAGGPAMQGAAAPGGAYNEAGADEMPF